MILNAVSTRAQWFFKLCFPGSWRFPEGTESWVGGVTGLTPEFLLKELCLVIVKFQ